MKKEKQVEMRIPSEAVQETNFGDEIRIQVFEHMMMLRNSKITALEVVKIIGSLESIIDDLYDKLRDEFPKDDMCRDCTFCRDYMSDIVDVPEWAKIVCGLDANAKLCICAEEDSGRILLEPVEYEHDILDVSESMRMRLSAMGVCLGEMNESIIAEEKI